MQPDPLQLPQAGEHFTLCFLYVHLTAADSVTVTPYHFQGFIWSCWQVSEYWGNFSITLLASPFQRPRFLTTTFPLQYLEVNSEAVVFCSSWSGCQGFWMNAGSVCRNFFIEMFIVQRVLVIPQVSHYTKLPILILLQWRDSWGQLTLKKFKPSWHYREQVKVFDTELWVVKWFHLKREWTPSLKSLLTASSKI